MIGSLSWYEIAAAMGAPAPAADFAVSGVTTDSRHIEVGELYVALCGERFDGHDFVAEAGRRGAAGALVQRRLEVDLPQLAVADTREALGLLARLNRRRFDGPVIGVTGSAGKTTCKEMIAAILRRSGAVLATSGNLNNEIGVPLTLLRLADEHRYAVIEMGAGRPGDIAYLCRFAEPTVGAVTTALPAHLEGMGDLDTVALTKGELYSGISVDGTAIINIDDPYAPQWRRQAGARRVLQFGLNRAADVSAREIRQSIDGLQFELVLPGGTGQVRLALLGLHNLRNALAACAAAHVVGAPISAMREGLAELLPVRGRLQPRRGLSGNLVIDDSYNANPGAVKAGIDVLATLSGRRHLILGNMAELGRASQAMHQEVARYAAAQGIEVFWCVGPWARSMAEAFGPGARAFDSNEELIAVCRHADTADAVLVKGSRSARMEAVVTALCGDPLLRGER